MSDNVVNLLGMADEVREGAVCWPATVQYDYSGCRFNFPPRHGVHFKIVVHDQARYDELCRSGWIRDPAHTGLAGGLTESFDRNRNPSA